MSNTWTLRDAMRLSHPKGVDPAVGSFILRGEVSEQSPAIIRDFKRVQQARNVDEVVEILHDNPSLPWEALPTQFLTERRVWGALFDNGLRGQALVRNVTRLARMNMFKDLLFAHRYAQRLTDESMIKQTRLHPFNYLQALLTHINGATRTYGFRERDWDVSGIIADALEDGFYRAHAYAEPANKRTLIAIDVSGSMNYGMVPALNMKPAEISAAVAMTVARTEPVNEIVAFQGDLRPIDITARTPIRDAINKTVSANFGVTDCAQPMLWASSHNREFDTFIVITDNETWAGKVKPFTALQRYRQSSGIPARLIVIGTNSDGFSIADPSDAGMLDIAGADSNLPKIITEFSAGRM